MHGTLRITLIACVLPFWLSVSTARAVPTPAPLQLVIDRYEALMTDGYWSNKHRQFTRAISAFQRAYEVFRDVPVEYGPGGSFALYQLASTYRNTEQYDDALRTYQRFLEEPRPWPAWNEGDRQKMKEYVDAAKDAVSQLEALQRRREREEQEQARQKQEQAAQAREQVAQAQEQARRAGKWYNKGWVWATVAGGVVVAVGLGIGLGVGLQHHDDISTFDHGR